MSRNRILAAFGKRYFLDTFLAAHHIITLPLRRMISFAAVEYEDVHIRYKRFVLPHLEMLLLMGCG